MRWEHEFFEAFHDIVVWDSKFVIDVKVLLNDLFVVQIDNFLLSFRKILTKVGNLFHESVDFIDHCLHHVGISLVCTFIA